MPVPSVASIVVGTSRRRPSSPALPHRGSTAASTPGGRAGWRTSPFLLPRGRTRGRLIICTLRVALRFASDAEAPALARKVLDEKIGDRKIIKQMIQT